MAAKKVGELIKEARTAAGMTQEALARKVSGLSAADISKTERGEMVPTQEQLKAIAKATGVTQKSLLEAPKPKTAASGKTSTGKTSSGKTSGGKTSSAKTSSAKKTDSETLTAAEKKFLKLYRAASTKDRELAKICLEGNAASSEFLLQVLGNKVGSGSSLSSLASLAGGSSSSSASSSASSGEEVELGGVLGNVLNSFLGKRELEEGQE